MTPVVVRLAPAGAFARPRGADYAWTGAAPSGVRARAAALCEVARAGLDAIVVLRADRPEPSAWLLRPDRGGLDEQGRPVLVARVELAIAAEPFGLFALAVAAYRRPRVRELAVADLGPGRPLSPSLRARLAFGRPASVAMAEAHAAGALLARYDGICLPVTRGLRASPAVEGLVVAGLELPDDPLGATLDALAPHLDDALAADLASRPRDEGDALLAWMADPSGPLPSEAPPAIELWARTRPPEPALAARLTRAAHELGQGALASPAARRYLVPEGAVDDASLAVALVDALAEGLVDPPTFVGAADALALPAVEPDRAMGAIASLVARGALGGDEASSERLVRALVPAATDAAADALVGWLALERPCFVPAPAVLPVAAWRALVPSLDPVAVLERFLAEPAEDLEREAICVAEIARRQRAPTCVVPDRRRRRHAATCAALGKLPGWEAHTPTDDERRAYVRAAAERVGLSPSSISFPQEPAHDPH